MGHPVLRLFDGSSDTSPQLSDEVRELQALLNQDGLSLDVDGVYDRATESAVKLFQIENDLMSDGVVGPLTWAALTRTEPPDVTRIFLTTFPVNDPSLVVQLTEALKYKEFLDNASAQSGFPPSLFGGIGSRESNWGLALRPTGPAGTGDFASRRFPTQFRAGPLPPDGGGFGRGLMQIDFDSQEFARTGNWQDPQANVLKSFQILSGFRDLIERKTNLSGNALIQATVASYNSGPGNVIQAIREGQDVDFHTAGRNYSKDVLNRAGWFQIRGWE